jgi:ribose transport system substrate-binding protein
LQEDIMKALVIAAGVLAGIVSAAPAVAQTKPAVAIIVKDSARVEIDNAKAGGIAADALAVAITRTYGDTEGNVAIITSRPGISALDQRTKGFKDVVAAKYRALALMDKAADGEPAAVIKIVKDLVAGTADLRGVFIADPTMTQVVAQGVLESKSSDKINIVGFGASAELVKLLESDVIAGLVVEDPSVDTGATLITKANMSSPRSQELLKSNMR